LTIHVSYVYDLALKMSADDLDQSSPRNRTRERILEGAVQALARHGLAKLEMRDVSQSAGVSRGTLYRYFSSREDLLRSLTIREAYRFWESCLAALQQAPEGEERIRLLLLYATRHVREHAALQRMLETDPGLVITSIQQQLPAIRGELQRLIGPLLESTQLVQSRIVTVSQLVEWLTRILISSFLIPSPDPAEMLRGLEAIYRLLTVRPTVTSNTGAPGASVLERDGRRSP
jgi:AcrR family transcriptional regulator